MKEILPSMPKGEIVGNMATAKMTQMIKVVIDGNRLCMENRGRNTEAETQTLATQIQTQMLQHKSET
jgi:GTP cyclohydrolase I